jgi:hypothetical protein
VFAGVYAALAVAGLWLASTSLSRQTPESLITDLTGLVATLHCFVIRPEMISPEHRSPEGWRRILR